MTLKNDNSADDTPEQIRFLELVMKYQDDNLEQFELDELADLLRGNPANLKQFRDIQLRTTMLQDVLRIDAFSSSSQLHENRDAEAAGQSRRSRNDRAAVTSRRRLMAWSSLGVIGFAVAMVVTGRTFWTRDKSDISSRETQVIVSTHQAESVAMVGESRATFFGSNGLRTGDSVTFDRDYMLQSGMVELKFPKGATAIIEGPSIFRVADQERLVVNKGSCSVHAPPGAEGFEILTPTTKLVDRGTRFFVNVQDDSETEVQVIEGAADLYSNAGAARSVMQESGSSSGLDRHLDIPIRLTNGEAIRIVGLNDTVGKPAPFNDGTYKSQLPDRLVGYEASSSANGSAEDLVSVTVQRDGRLQTLRVDELIPIKVTWYRSDAEADPNGQICGDLKRPTRPEDLLEDRNLRTGLINFGGQSDPLKQRPSIGREPDDWNSGTPGLAIRFQTPVVNQAGPDFLFFEIQCFSQFMEGDPFHIYPLDDRQDLKPMTVKKFDLTMESPQSRMVKPLWSHRYKTPIVSLDQLSNTEAPLVVDVGYMHFRAIGVGIDLSQLGYAEGEPVEQLFFQHASFDGKTKVDPVYIAGLPRLSP